MTRRLQRTKRTILNVGKLGPQGTRKKRLGRHKTERKGTVTRKLGGSPQKWDILKTILRIKTKSKPVRKVRTTQHVRTTRHAVANESKVPHGHPNNKTGTGITNINSRFSINNSTKRKGHSHRGTQKWQDYRLTPPSMHTLVTETRSILSHRGNH